MSLWRIVCGLLVATIMLGGQAAQAQSPEKRIALVIGNGAYADGALATPANDAGLVAQTLQAAGFDVVGARDLDNATLRSTFREFLDKAAASGPDTVVFVYYAGYGLQFEGENYLVPVDARIARDTDVPLAAIRLGDLVKPLAALPLKARIVALDAARTNPFARSDQPLAGGLALMQPDPGSLIAFNAAPGTIAPEGKDYSAYATALSEMIKEGGLSLDDVFERVRLRTSELTGGSELPWSASKIQVPFLFFERTSAAPPEQTRFLDLRNKPVRDFDARDAYLAALTRDTMRGYEDFLAAYPRDPLAKRVRAILAARREAVVWRESAIADTPEAYWSYLGRYPRGPHAGDARRRLSHFAVAFEPPAAFTALSYDVPPPPPDEIVYVERPVVYFADPVYELPPPPPVPVVFLPPQPAYYVDLPPPPPPIAAFVLPIPIYHPVPLWVQRPAYVAPPPVNLINVNIHNTVVVNPATQTVTVTDPQGRQEPLLPPTVPAGAPGPAAQPLQPAQPGALQHMQQLIQAHPAAAAAIAATAAALPAAAALRARQQAQPLRGPAATVPAPQPGVAPGAPAAAVQPRPGQPPQPNQPIPARPFAATVPAGAKPLPTPGTLPAGPGGAAPAQRLATPPAAGQPNRPLAPPVTAGPQAAPSRPLAATVPGPHAPATAAGRPAAPLQPAQPPQAAAAAAAQQRAQQAAALQAQQQRAAQAAQQKAAMQAQSQQRAAQAAQQRATQARAAAQQQAQQRAAMQAQAQQQRAAQAAQQRAAMQAQQQAQQRAAMQAQAQQQRAAQAAQAAQQRAAMQAQQRAQSMARQRAPQPQPQHRRCEPGQPMCR